ncbi:tRNA 2'-phosphotransferase 1, partial [Cladochytrium tenue]
MLTTYGRDDTSAHGRLLPSSSFFSTLPSPSSPSSSSLYLISSSVLYSYPFAAMRRSRGSGGGHGSGGNTAHNERLSKALSWLLRHAARDEGVPVRDDGFVCVRDVLAHPRFRGYSLADVRAVVRDNDKQRFHLAPLDGDEGADDDDPGSWMIRANQGHSMASVEVDLQEILDPAEIPVVLHGTERHKLAAIMATGLCRMRRNHIHFAVGRPGASGVISGMRRACDTIIVIDVARAMQ